MASSINDWRAREWGERLERYRESGATVSMFCRQEDVSVASFYLWRKKLGENSRHRQKAKAREPVFAPIRLVSSPTMPLVTVQLPGGTRLEIPMSDSDAYERTIKVLVSVDAERTLTPPAEEA